MKKPSRRILLVTKKDFIVQTFRDTGVRIVHRDSGASGISREHRTQKRNREAAFSRLVLTEIFQTWLRMETTRRLENQHEMRRRLNRDVERMMIPRLLRVEVRRDGRWVHEYEDN
jgi:hypothetical protein